MKNETRTYSFPFTIDEIDLEGTPFLEYDRTLSETENIKRKNHLIQFGKALRKNGELDRAVLFYKYLCNNTYFSNDWHPYRELAAIYSSTEDHSANLINIKKLLYSKIYLNNYQIVWFGEKIRQISDEISVEDETLEEWFNYYESHGRLNKSKLNGFLADRFIAKEDMVIVLDEENFERSQEMHALEETGMIYERVGNLSLAIVHYSNIISKGEFNCCRFHKRRCLCLEKAKDYQRELKAIRQYFTNPPSDRSERCDEWFSKRLERLNADYRIGD